ncbi:DUF7008 domain-containing protein [Streptomyces cahuitamycinicus]|uniref:DUF7008 domain-containing protein n=1 Tax=Streptomyces cahuitamycinicus TaxID=2070367 RepID=UPI0015E11A88|nr:hypothetical protein [Streptomyces cahuitamycinicus]
MPKERFISYPGASPEADGSLLLGWAGWNHRDQADALAGLIRSRVETGGWTKGDPRFVPLLAGLREVFPWGHQWYGEYDEEWEGNPAEKFQAALDTGRASVNCQRRISSTGVPRRRHAGGSHVVDNAGYSDLLFGAPARCRDLKVQGEHVTVMPEIGEGFLGGPFDRLRLRTRGVNRLEAGVLGRGTPQHEKLLSRLVERVAGRAACDVRAPARRGPQFDLGWISDRTPYGAWATAPQGSVTDETNRLVEAVAYVGRSSRSGARHGQVQRVVVVEDAVDLNSGLREKAQASGVLVAKIKDVPR